MHRLILIFSCSILYLFSTSLTAEEMQIETEFRPSADNPGVDKFTNLTPESGYCLDRPAYCDQMGVLSLLTGLRVTDRVFDSNSSDLRRRSYQRLNSSWRTVTLLDKGNSQNIQLEFRLVMLSQRITPKNPSSDTGWDTYTPPTGGCKNTVGWGTTSWILWAWGHQEGVSTCHRQVSKIDDTATLSAISIGYELRAPDPMTLPNGNFSGSISYSVGKDQDIDLGEGAYSDSELTFNIQSNIQHELKVEHLGSPKVKLEPVGGWDDWVGNGASQFRLEGKGNFTIVASSPVSITARCDQQVLNDCAIQKEGGDGDPVVVPLALMLTIPEMVDAKTGEAINKTLIPAYAPQTPGIVMKPVDLLNHVATVDFSVNEVSSLRMGQYPGSAWKAGVTLIFDSELPFWTSDGR